MYRCGSISSHAFVPVENQRVSGVLYMMITYLDTEGSNVAHRAVVRGVIMLDLLVCWTVGSKCWKLCITVSRVVRLAGGCIISCVLGRAARKRLVCGWVLVGMGC